MSTGDVPLWTGYPSSFQEISLDPKIVESIERLERNMEKVMERLAVLDDPDPKRLEEFKTLKEAYDKYQFVDKLCGKNNEEDD